MKKAFKIFSVMIVLGVSFLAASNANANKAKCATGNSKICFIVTVNGNETASCNTTESSTKDCA